MLGRSGWWFFVLIGIAIGIDTDGCTTGDTPVVVSAPPPNKACNRRSTVFGVHVVAMADPRCFPKRASVRTSFQWSETTPTVRGCAADSSACLVASADSAAGIEIHHPVSWSCGGTREPIGPFEFNNFERTAPVATPTSRSVPFTPPLPATITSLYSFTYNSDFVVELPLLLLLYDNDNDRRLVSFNRIP